MLFLLVGLAAASQAADKATLRLNWYAHGIHAPFYAALDKGWYKDAGLDLEILEGSGSGTTVKLIGNRSNTFGFADAGTAIAGISQGVPVKVISPIYQINGFAVVTLADSGIKAPKDLEGKRLGVTPGDALSQLFPAFVSANRIDDSKITYVSMDASAKPPALMNRQIDAIIGGADDQAITVRSKGFAVTELRFAHYGVPTIGLSLLAHEDTIKENPRLVKRFLEATLRGWDFARKNPAEAIRIEKKYVPTLDESRGLSELNVAISCLFSKDAKWLGRATDADWEKTVELMVKYRGLSDKLPASAYYTNSVLPDSLPTK
jgi:NitT/TauT family transport system substrate-binding protein